MYKSSNLNIEFPQINRIANTFSNTLHFQFDKQIIGFPASSFEVD